MTHRYRTGRSFTRSLAVILLVPLFLQISRAQDFTLPKATVISSETVLRTSNGEPGPAALARMKAAILAHREAKLSLTPAERKISALLLGFEQHVERRAARRHGVQPAHPLVQTDALGRVRVALSLTEASPENLATLEAVGTTLRAVNRKRGSVVLSVPYDKIRAVAAPGFVRKVEPVIAGATRAGSITSEGVQALNVDDVHSMLGLDGTGVKVCVISNGIENAAAAQATDDLPSSLEVCPFTSLGVENQGDEGTAMLEIVHDLAPGALLGFCPAFGPTSEAGLAGSITWLAQNAFGGTGCDIIVDDVGFLTQPYFEDDIVADAVNAAAAGGTAYFSSAGNAALSHYEHPYADATPGSDTPLPLADLHDFGQAAGLPSDPVWLGLVAGEANFFIAVLQWNDPFGNSGNDYDLYLFDQNGFPAGDPNGDFPIGGLGVSAQDGDGIPLEIAFVVNTNSATPPDPIGTALPFFIVIDRRSGDADKLLEMNFNGFFGLDDTYNVPEGSVWGHPAAEGAIAVGAIDAGDPGLNDIEPFSSRGPARIFFPTVEERAKPDITAVDAVSVTGAGGFPSPFFGTSASAPHAAAVAALLKQADPSLTPEQLEAVLASTAADLGPPGFDATFGAGRIDAFAAAKSLVLDTTPPECEMLTLAEGSPASLAVRIQDTGSGLNSVTILKDKNATVTWPTFTPGSTAPLMVTAVKRNEHKYAVVALRVTDMAGNSRTCDPVVETLSAGLPERFALEGNYPNPFNPRTTIRFHIPEASFVRLIVHDALGREVARLVNEEMEPGSYEATFDAAALSSGLYLYRIEAGAFIDVRPMLLAK